MARSTSGALLVLVSAGSERGAGRGARATWGSSGNPAGAPTCLARPLGARGCGRAGQAKTSSNPEASENLLGPSGLRWNLPVALSPAATPRPCRPFLSAICGCQEPWKGSTFAGDRGAGALLDGKRDW